MATRVNFPMKCRLQIKIKMDANKKTRCPNWTERDRIILVQNVLQHEDVLFGKFKGAGRDAASKEATWKAIQGAVNARQVYRGAPFSANQKARYNQLHSDKARTSLRFTCVEVDIYIDKLYINCILYEASGEAKNEQWDGESDVPRSIEQLKKQYDNIKTRAKQKIDEIRRPKTGGGPKPPSPSSSQQLVIDQMGDRPTMVGISLPLDTDDPQYENHFMLEADTVALTVPVECTVPVPAAGSWDEASYSRPTNPCALTQPDVMSTTKLSSKTSTSTGMTTTSTKKRKRTDCEEELLKVEIRRAEAEITKINLETELLKARQLQEEEIFQLKKSVLISKLNFYSSK